MELRLGGDNLASTSRRKRQQATTTADMLDRIARRYGRKFKRKYDLDTAQKRSRVKGATGVGLYAEADTV